MSTELSLPKLGFAMTEGTLAEWLVSDGEYVTAGQVIYSLENDKATSEVEAPVAGTIRIIAPAGELYPVGTPLAVIE